MGNKKLKVNNLTFGYSKDREILHGISCGFAEGKITALLGANGCGKSTLLNLLAGSLKPSGGEVLIEGVNITSYKRQELAQKIATVHQNNMAPADITVRKLVAAGRTPYHKLLKNSSESDVAAIEKAMRYTDIEALADRQITELSGGQMQRVWMAMALAQDTEVLLLDEITTYLDVHYQLEIMDLISRINREEDRTIIMVLHDINLAFDYCHEAVVMKDGHILAAGDIASVADEEVLGKAFNVVPHIIENNNKKYCIFSRKGGTDVY